MGGRGGSSGMTSKGGASSGGKTVLGYTLKDGEYVASSKYGKNTVYDKDGNIVRVLVSSSGAPSSTSTSSKKESAKKTKMSNMDELRSRQSDSYSYDGSLKGKSFSNDYQQVKSLPVDTIAKIGFGDGTSYYARKTANNSWNAERSGGRSYKMTDNDIATYRHDDASVFYMYPKKKKK